MNRQMKVGVFVLFGLSLMGFAVFLIGENRKFWESKVTYRAAFHDVAGLKPGGPVRSGGIDIGTVTSVGHSPDASDSRIYVTIGITKAEAPRVRATTVAKVVNKGLLGDKMIELSVVDDGDAAEPGALLTSEDPKDMLANVDALAVRARTVVERLEPLAKQLGEGDLAKNINGGAEALKGSADALRKILEGVANTDSVAHRVLFDPEAGKRFQVMMNNLSEASSKVNGIMENVNALTAQARDKRGLVGALLYDEGLKNSVAGTLASVNTTMAAVNDPDNKGLVHAAFYGDDSTKGMMANFNKMSTDLSAIVSGIRQGKGTIGALLVDPTIYEDIKSAIGNVERNQVLRALVRYSIKADEARPRVETR